MDISSLSNLSLEGKVAVVTGSTQGLGEAICHLFAARGCRGIIVTGRDASRGERTATTLAKKGVRACFVQADLADPDQLRQIIAAADRTFGRLDILVNAAAITDRGSIWNTDLALYDQMMAVNVRAPFFLIQDAVKLMRREQIAGSIINIISMSGHGGQSFISAYSISKGALITLTKNLAYSVMAQRIRINGLCIGWMDTPGEDRIMKLYHKAGDDWLAKAEATRPFGRLLKPDEVARACAYLASDESGLMTGSIIDFDQQVLGAANAIPALPED